jgi:hypothetical protein
MGAILSAVALRCGGKAATNHSWRERIIMHNEFVVNILEGAISGKKKGLWKTSITVLKASLQIHRS